MIQFADECRDSERLGGEINSCRRCPRLVEWREERAADPPKRYRGEEYWARPLNGFGDPAARLAIVGLAPAAHGANRTGRMFTGDRSGEWLYAALHRAGLATGPVSERRGDDLRLDRRLPDRRRPLRAARQQADPRASATTAFPTWSASSTLLTECRAILALGSFAWDGALRALRGLGAEVPRPRPRFGHEAEARVGRWALVGSYHPSQQNTFTGRLTEPMLDAAIARALERAR